MTLSKIRGPLLIKIDFLKYLTQGNQTMYFPETYVIHFDKLVERKVHLEEQIEREGLRVEWFIQRGEDFYTKEEIARNYKYDTNEWIEKIKIAKLNRIPRPLGKAEVNLSINHFKLLEIISKDKGKLFLILEDDVVLCEEFTYTLHKVLAELEKIEWDICFLDWCNTTPHRKGGIVEIVDQRGNEDHDSWGLAAYLIKPRTAAELLRDFDHFTLCCDDEIRYLVKKKRLVPKWALPPLTEQGSFYGKFTSSLSGSREKSGIKKYVFWRKGIYILLRRVGLEKAADLLEKLEAHIRKRLLKI
jgi:GR25 family glycosyltransferase involved in LPS biosynthesis